MKDFRKELLTISDTLSSLEKQINRMIGIFETKNLDDGVHLETDRKPPKVQVRKKSAGNPEITAETASASTILNDVLGLINRSRSGITIDRLKKHTGLEARQVSNALYKLTKKGKVQTVSRGRYIKKKNGSL